MLAVADGGASVGEGLGDGDGLAGGDGLAVGGGDPDEGAPVGRIETAGPAQAATAIPSDPATIARRTARLEMRAPGSI